MREIFTFGSNLSGIHGAGAARYAFDHLGAVWGVGEGLTGCCYALPTKDKKIMTIPLSDVAWFVGRFLVFAEKNPELHFKVTRIGCGLAGFKDEDIAPLFTNAPANCFFDTAWRPYLEQYDSASDKLDRSKLKNYWGTFG